MTETPAPLPAVSAADAVVAARPGVVVVTLLPGALRMPTECAGCGGFAAASQVLGAGARAISVPYCGTCLRHASAAATRELASIVASLLATAALVGGAPLLWPWASALAVTVGAAAAGAVPIVATRWLLPRLLRGAWRGRAVYYTSRGELACRRPAFAEHAAALSGSAVLRTVQRAEPLGRGVWLAPLLALVGGPLLHWIHHPLVRVLSFQSEATIIEVDGRVVAEVLGTSLEDPAAGRELRLPAGRRRLVARTRSGVLADEVVVLRSGRQHLYVPGPRDRCFWLETTSYGREGPSAGGRVELDRGASFWVLPAAIDTWFSPNPAAPNGARASGGSLTALRQARCRDVPATATVDR